MENNEIKMHEKSKHLGSEERFKINKMLNDYYTPSAIAESLGVPVSTITREIKKHRKLVINHRTQNVCGNKIVCYERNNIDCRHWLHGSNGHPYKHINNLLPV